jgi:hypothetical protein
MTIGNPILNQPGFYGEVPMAKRGVFSFPEYLQEAISSSLCYTYLSYGNQSYFNHSYHLNRTGF